MSFSALIPTVFTVGDLEIVAVYVSSEVGSGDDDVIKILFNRNIFSPTTDYATGITIKIDTVPDAILTDALTGGGSEITLTMTSTAIFGEEWTIEYSSGPGDLEDALTGEPIASFGPFVITMNAFAGKWDFSLPEHSGQYLTVGF